MLQQISPRLIVPLLKGRILKPAPQTGLIDTDGAGRLTERRVT